jgi:hypothetical protein
MTFKAISGGFSVAALATLAVIAAPGQSQAATFNLNNLLTPGASITSGDLTFSDFSFNIASTSGITQPINASSINVITLNDDGSRGAGLRFQGNWFADGANGGSSVDTLLNFKVVAAAGKFIDSAFLKFNGAVASNDGSGGASVAETISRANGTPLRQLEVNDEFVPGSLTDSANFRPQQSLLIAKDILLVAGNRARGIGSGDASISFIDQRFNTTAVPTPALLPGLVGMGIAALRRKQKATADQA